MGSTVRCDALEQKETDFVDLSSESDLILALFLPARTVDNLSGPDPELCQVQVAENEEATPTLFHIYWLGKGPALYSVGDSSRRYARVVSYVPPVEDRLAEAVSLCGFIQATVAGDNARRSEEEEDMRLCLGLKQPK
jgi:hypothetical protein